MDAFEFAFEGSQRLGWIRMEARSKGITVRGDWVR